MGIQVIKGGSSAYLKLAGDVALTSSLVSVVDQTNTVSGLQLATASIGLTMPTFLALPNWTNTLGTKTGFNSQQTVAVASLGTGVFKMINSSYTINNTAAQTGTITGFFQNATETALNGITHNLMNLQVGGVNKFVVKNTGEVISANNISATSGGYLGWEARSAMRSVTDGRIILYNFALSGFDLLQLGGTTSSFPAIKRNGAGIDFRLADDSNYAALNTGATFIKGSGTTSATNSLLVQNSASTQTLKVNDDGSINIGQQLNNNFPYINLSGIYGGLFLNTGDSIVFRCTGTEAMRVNAALSVGIGVSTIDASAKLQIDTTTQGFLPPRMTTAQVNAIATPANGLQVYNTTLNQPCFYDGTIWNKVNHSPM